MSGIGKKLQLKHEHTVLLLNAPNSIADGLMQEGYRVTNAIETPTVGIYDAVQIFVLNKNDVELLVPQAIGLLKPDGQLWVAYPKKSSGIETDISRDKGWSNLKELGYTGVRLISFDDTWSSLRFRHDTERKKISMLGVDLPGIDRKTKTVVPPEDMSLALLQAGLVDQFNKQTFTQRKEMVVAVLEAKRPETRDKRILKAIKQLRNQ